MDDEIDLRAYAELLWRGRYAMAAITLTAVLGAFLVSRFLLPPVYEASVLLVVESQGPPSNEHLAQLQISQLVAVARPAPLDAKGYQEIAQSSAFQAAVRQRAQQLLGREGAHRVAARVIPQTALVELTAEAPRPDQAASLANAAASLLLEEAEHLNRSRLERALALLEGSISQARANLDQALEHLQVFTRRGPSVEERQNELSGKLQLLAEYQKRLTQLDVILTAETTKLNQVKAQLSAEPQRLTLKKALSPEAGVLNQVLRGLGLPVGETLMNLDDEQLNPVYVDLRRHAATQEATVAALQAEREKVQTTLDQLSREAQNLTSELIGLQAEQRELTWQADMARRMYETAVAQYEAQKVVLAARLGESALSLVRQASLPDGPTKPRPLLNAAVAGFVGLMVSMFGVFFAEFWRQPVRAEAGRPLGVTAHGS